MHNKKIKLDFHDLRVKPSIISDISSRKEINPFYLNKDLEKYLPIFTAPMDTVIDNKNFEIFKKNKIHTIIPRGEKQDFSISSEAMFNALSLQEFKKIFIDSLENNYKLCENDNINYILIDMANGHMRELINVVKIAKEEYKEKLVLMVGNIANPKTFEEFCKIGVDYLRIGIGNGNACLTTKQTTIGYPMASLINECYKIKEKNNYITKIVADGGMKDFSDIILGLALGADYIMVGSLLNKTLESCADTYLFKKIRINQYSKFALWLFKNRFKLTKKFRGMSTKEVQKKWGKINIKTSEGVSKRQNVEYTTKQWIENFEDYLRSTMSYTNSRNLNEFIGKVKTIRISDKSYNRFNK